MSFYFRHSNSIKIIQVLILFLYFDKYKNSELNLNIINQKNINLKTVNKESNLGFYNFTQNDISNYPDIEINPNDVKSHPNVKCTYENCHLYQGVCYEDKCICAYGFTTFNKNPLDPSIYCNYKQKY